MATTERHERFLTAGMSHSLADDSLVKNLVSPSSSPMSGESEEEEEEVDELQNSVESRENGLYGQEEELEEVEEAREGNTRTTKGPLGRANANPQACALSFQELVPSVCSW